MSRITQFSLACLITTLFCFNSFAGNSYSGSMGSAFYTFNRPTDYTTLSGQQVHYHAVYFTVQGTTPGNVTVSVIGNGFTPQVYMYQYGEFDPSNPLFNLYAFGSGTFTATNFSQGLEIPHVLIVSGFNPGDIGSFTVIISGPGTVVVAPDNDSSLVMREDPASASVLTGSTVTMRTWASGREPQTFQWYYGPRPDDADAPDPSRLIAGATSFTYTTPPLTVSTSYWCLVNGPSTTPSSVRSGEAVVQVAAQKTSFTGVLATDHDTWQRMTAAGVPSGTTPYYEVRTFQILSSGYYTVTLNTTNFTGAMNWYSGKFFPVTPAVNFYGDGVVANSPGTLTYSTYLTAGTYDLVISSASSGETGTYGGTIEGPSVPQLQPSPNQLNILNPPVDLAVLTNVPSQLAIGLEGAYPRTTQWYQGTAPDTSQPVPGGTSTTLSLPAYATVRTNLYWALVSNNYGAVTTATVQVMIVDKFTSFKGKLRDGNRTWHAPDGKGGQMPGETYWKTFAFTANTVGQYTLTLDTTNFTGAIHIYQGKPSTNLPNLNHYAALTDGPSNHMALKFGTASPGTFYVLITSRDYKQTGDYGGIITGPSPVFMLPAPDFVQQPTPTTEYRWLGTPGAPITFISSDTNATATWAAVTNGSAEDLNFEGVPGTNNYPVTTPTAPLIQETVFLRARQDNAYGYEDGDVATIYTTKPIISSHPAASRTDSYGNDEFNFVSVDGAPMDAQWVLATATATNVVFDTFFQASSITNMVYNKVFGYILDHPAPGSYQMWVYTTNRNGATLSDPWNITINPVPIAIQVNGTNFNYTGLPAAIPCTFTGPILVTVPSNLPLNYTVNGVTSTNAPTNAGTYVVTISSADPGFLGTNTATISIQKVPLDIAADNVSILAGATPQYTFHYTGLVGNDNASTIDVFPTLTVTSNAQNGFGIFPIHLSGGSDNNYNLTLHDATLTVCSYPVVPDWQVNFSNPPAAGALLGNAAITNGALYLTHALPSQAGAYVLPSLGRNLKTLHVSFDLQIGGGTGAEGFSFNFAGDATNYAANPQNGLGTGLSIAVDTHDNGGQTVPSLTLKYHGTNLVQQYQPTLHNNQPHNIAVDFNTGFYNLWLDNVVVAQGFISAFQPGDWPFTFAAATGGLTDNHSVNNIVIGERPQDLVIITNGTGVALSLATGFGSSAGLVTVSNPNPERVFGTVSNLIATIKPGASNFNGTTSIYLVLGNASLKYQAHLGGLRAGTPYDDGFGDVEVPWVSPPGAVVYLQRAPAPNGPWQLADVGSIGDMYGGPVNQHTNYFFRLLAAPP